MQEAIGKWSFQQNVLWGTTTEEVYEVIYIEPRSALQIKRILVEDKDDDAPKVLLFVQHYWNRGLHIVMRKQVEHIIH